MCIQRMTTETPTIFQDAGLDNLTLEFVYHACYHPYDLIVLEKPTKHKI